MEEITNALKEAADDEFEVIEQTQKKGYISKETWNKITERNDARKKGEGRAALSLSSS